jgi:lipoprotein signal peptidase
VPDPLVRGGIAFNLADVAIAAGDALLLAAALQHAWTNRTRLREPV